MPSSNSRIISAEELGDVEPFSLGALPGGPETPIKRSAVVKPAATSNDDTLRQTFELGYRKGMEAGRSAAIQQLAQQERAIGATLRQRVEAFSASMENELSEFQTTAADRLLDLAIEIAQQTIRDVVAVRRESVLPIVQEALDQLYDEGGSATLFVNPIDADIVQTHLAAMLARRNITVRPDADVGMGGCRLSSVSADVDATLATRWRRTLSAMGRVFDDDSATMEIESPYEQPDHAASSGLPASAHDGSDFDDKTDQGAH